MKILIAEDDHVSAKLLEVVLSPYGECEIKRDGKTALRAYEDSHSKKDSYDLVCMDIMMPEINGIDVLKMIRKIEGKKENRKTKIIMITALGDLSNINKAFRAGCDGYITKPVDENRLMLKLQNLGLIQN